MGRFGQGWPKGKPRAIYARDQYGNPIKVKRDDFVRNRRGCFAARALRQFPLFEGMPTALVEGYGRLLSLSNEVGSDLRKIKKRDRTLAPDGVWASGIALYAMLKEKERKYLATMAELAIATRQGQFQVAGDKPPSGWKPTLMQIKEAFLAEIDAPEAAEAAHNPENGSESVPAPSSAITVQTTSVQPQDDGEEF
jgi:hypothetical protein